MKKMVILRRLSQAFFLALFVYILWSTTYPLQGALPPETFFRTNPNIMLFTSISERMLLPGLLLSVGMILLTLALGRFYCGWICPLGTMIDISGAIRKKGKDPHNFPRHLYGIKFLVMVVIFAFSVFGIQLAWVLDPMGIMARFVSLNLIPTITLITDRTFIFLIRDLELYGPLHDVYRSLRNGVLGVEVHYFDSSLWIFLFFAVVCSAAIFIPRYWCRTVCPLGAIYSLAARRPLLRRIVDRCIDCGNCVSDCRMGAITEGRNYESGECILCMDCLYDCPVNATRFTFNRENRNVDTGPVNKDKRGLTRRNFLFLLLSSLFSLGMKWGGRKNIRSVIRPPGALNEELFVSRCIRCGNCMKVCPTNGLQPVFLQSGIDGIWTPQLVPEIGYCEYNCNLCGNVCPTEAIARLPAGKKKEQKLGLAEVDRTSCIAWASHEKCIVCEEHCPIPQKAIKTDDVVVEGKLIKRPVVDPMLCVGCGICQTKCPVRPERAIKVRPL